MSRRYRVLVVNQYFPPDRAATALLLGQFTADLSRNLDITVICGTPTYDPESSKQVWPDTVRIVRAPLIRAGRKNMATRLLNYLFFLGGACFRALCLPRPDIVICWTDPPLVGLIGAAVKFVHGSRFIFVSQDVYPEIVTATGRMNYALTRKVLAIVSKTILSSADKVVSVGEEMRRVLLGKGCRLDQTVVIPNWQDHALLRPVDPSLFRARHGISSHVFVVMHSGNIGFSQDFETLLAAAEKTRDDRDILYCIVGNGGRRDAIARLIHERRLSNVLLLPYQDSEHLAESLSAADIHYVSLLPALTGMIVPSKIYGILSVGRPVVANVRSDCEIARIVAESRCGTRIEPDPMALASLLVEWKGKRDELLRMGMAGMRWSETFAGRGRATRAYFDLTESLKPADI